MSPMRYLIPCQHVGTDPVVCQHGIHKYVAPLVLLSIAPCGISVSIGAVTAILVLASILLGSEQAPCSISPVLSTVPCQHVCSGHHPVICQHGTQKQLDPSLFGVCAFCNGDPCVFPDRQKAIGSQYFPDIYANPNFLHMIASRNYNEMASYMDNATKKFALLVADC